MSGVVWDMRNKPNFRTPVRGSSENLQKKTGPQMHDEETKNLRFINIEAEHQFLLKLQENDLDAVEELRDI